MTMLHIRFEDEAKNYHPYNRMDEFLQGAADYVRGTMRNLQGVAGQAYDRGAECAMRVQRHNDWVEQNVGLN